MPRLSLSAFLFVALLGHAVAAPMLKSNARVVFVGDSITGQGGNGGPTGWVGRIRTGMIEEQPGDPTLVALGGSGQTVGSWMNIEKRSREHPVTLDVKTFDVQAELAKPADALVIMLGMNDALAPQVNDTPESIASWVSHYKQLLDALRDRVHPGLIALATPTPCTEDPNGPKNLVMDKMVVALKQLAEKEHCVLLPTRATDWEVLNAGRRHQPDFHITRDQVHPNTPGHMAIAAGMLRGLGYDKAADRLVAMAIATAGDSAWSHELSLIDQGQVDAPCRFRIKLYHPAGQEPKLTLPDGWSVADSQRIDGGTEVTVKSAPEVALVSVINAKMGDHVETIDIPAPWLTVTGNTNRRGWHGFDFDPAEAGLPLDDAIRTGDKLTSAMSAPDLAAGVPASWRLYTGGIDFGGAGRPDVIDFAAVTYFLGGATGYGLRWVHSDHARDVTVEIARFGFAGWPYVQVWANGDQVFAGSLRKGGTRTGTARLKAGWNLISFKSNYSQWQWQLRVDLKPLPGDKLDDLRYSAMPH